MNKRKYLLLAVCLVLFPLSFAVGKNKEFIPKLLVFHSPGCSRCLEVKRDLLPNIEGKYKEKLIVEYYDLSDIKNYELLIGLREKYGSQIELSLPVFFMQGNFLNGKSDLKSTLDIFIEGSLVDYRQELGPARVDLLEHFKDIKPLVIIGSGLVDGINPCAFTVIVFFISYLSLQGYRKRELVATGISFVFAVFATYTLVGLGVFNFLYRLQLFWFFARTFNLGVGILSILLGVLAFYDFLKYRRTKNSEGLILQLPESIKKRIHSIIGLHYRRPAEERTGEVTLSLSRLILSALITGFLVSLLEAVCTGQLYLPTIAFVLKTTPLKFQAFWYLVIYNIMFILPLTIIFILALFGFTSGQFSAFLKKHLSFVKVVMVCVFFSLGIFLIWRG
ncbi:MAG: hypothetical protein BWY16_00813 [Candidatus Omnitrophica bacterium ADurb.Bin205]|nr:MAG: hypothetical protein BWY16_00813 [Candidatus Omnitrophica bacterium ADurb.Bin205]